MNAMNSHNISSRECDSRQVLGVVTYFYVDKHIVWYLYKYNDMGHTQNHTFDNFNNDDDVARTFQSLISRYLTMIEPYHVAMVPLEELEIDRTSQNAEQRKCNPPNQGDPSASIRSTSMFGLNSIAFPGYNQHLRQFATKSILI